MGTELHDTSKKRDLVQMDEDDSLDILLKKL